MTEYLKGTVVFLGFPDWPPRVIQLLVICLANAFTEELVFRMAVFSALQARSKVLQVTVSATAFGLIHLSAGMPDGMLGVTASTLYGIVLAHSYAAHRSMLLPVLSHTAVNLTMFSMLL